MDDVLVRAAEEPRGLLSGQNVLPAHALHHRSPNAKNAREMRAPGASAPGSVLRRERVGQRLLGRGAQLELDGAVIEKLDGARIAGPGCPIHEGMDTLARGGDLVTDAGRVQLPPPDGEELPEGEGLLLGSLDVDEAARGVGVQPVDT